MDSEVGGIDAGDPNTYVAIIKWDSMQNANKYTGSPELKAAMEKAGVAGPPTFYFLNDTSILKQIIILGRTSPELKVGCF